MGVGGGGGGGGGGRGVGVRGRASGCFARRGAARRARRARGSGRPARSRGAPGGGGGRGAGVGRRGLLRVGRRVRQGRIEAVQGFARREIVSGVQAGQRAVARVRPRRVGRVVAAAWQGLARRGELAAELGERDDARFSVGRPEGHAFGEDVVGQHLLTAARRDQGASFLREALPTLHIELVLVAETAHESPARAGDLGRVEREMLVLGYPEVDRAELGQPGGRAVLSTAAAHTVQSLRLIAGADLLELDASAEERREVADEVPEVDPLVGGEIERELLSVPLPLGVGQLHHEPVGLDPLDRLASRGLVLRTELAGLAHLTGRREPERLARRRLRAAAVGAPGGSALRDFAGREHDPEVLPTVRLHHDRRLRRWRLVALPGEELLSVPLEGDLDQVHPGKLAAPSHLAEGAAAYSWNWPMRTNFSRRRRTSLSGLRWRRSSRFRTSACWSALAATS